MSVGNYFSRFRIYSRGVRRAVMYLKLRLDQRQVSILPFAKREIIDILAKYEISIFQQLNKTVLFWPRHFDMKWWKSRRRKRNLRAAFIKHNKIPTDYVTFYFNRLILRSDINSMIDQNLEPARFIASDQKKKETIYSVETFQESMFGIETRGIKGRAGIQLNL